MIAIDRFPIKKKKHDHPHLFSNSNQQSASNLSFRNWQL